MAYAGAVFVREINDREFTFGVSGLLYKSNLLMYDHQTESLWLQVKRRAVTGPMTGTRLKRLPSTITSWEKWQKKYSETRVLSFKTGYTRDYSKDPYEDYYRSSRGLFGFLKPGPGAEEKEIVIGVEVEGDARAYWLKTVKHNKEITDTVSGRRIKLKYSEATDLVTVQDDKEELLDHVTTYWMVWKGIYPETVLHGE